MSEPDQQPREESREFLQRLEQEAGPRREYEPPPVYGADRPLPQSAPPAGQTMTVRLPLSQPRVWYILLAINIIIFLASGLISGDLFNPSNQVLQLLGDKENSLIARGEYWRLFSAMFLHANVLHILFNGYALYVLGPQTERIYGTLRFLVLYGLAGLAGNVASYELSKSSSVGASGAIFGLVGGLAAFYYLSRGVLGQIARQQLGSLITVVMINLFLGFSATNIDNTAHLGGLLSGLLVGWLLAPRMAIDSYSSPPRIVRQTWPLGWAGVIGVLVVLALVVLLLPSP